MSLSITSSSKTRKVIESVKFSSRAEACLRGVELCVSTLLDASETKTGSFRSLTVDPDRLSGRRSESDFGSQLSPFHFRFSFGVDPGHRRSRAEQGHSRKESKLPQCPIVCCLIRSDQDVLRSWIQHAYLGPLYSLCRCFG